MPLITREHLGKIRDTGLDMEKASFAFTLGDPDGEDIWVGAIESPPCRVNVSFQRRKERHQFKIDLPWTYLIGPFRYKALCTHYCMMFFANKKAETMEETVYVPPLPNIMHYGSICFGTVEISVKLEPFEQFRSAFEKFWDAPFTGDVWPGRKTLPAGFEKPPRRERDLSSIFRDWEMMNRLGKPIRWRTFRVGFGKPKLRTIGEAMSYLMTRY